MSSPTPTEPPQARDVVLFPEFPGFANATLEWIKVILEFLASASWPLLLLFVFWTIWRRKNRGDVSKVIKAAFQSIRMLKIGEVEAHFTEKEAQQQLETIKSYVEKGANGPAAAEASTNTVPPAESDGKGDPSAEGDLSGERPISVQPDPRMVVLEAYELLENALRRAIASIPAEEQQMDKVRDLRISSWSPERWTMTALMRVAARSELLTRSELKGLDEIRRMRNRIAHFPSGVDISEETAQEYADQCETMVSRVLDRSQRWQSAPALSGGPEGIQS